MAFPSDFRHHASKLRRSATCARCPWVGGFEVVQRLDWGDTPIYVSFDDAKQGRLLGAAVFDAHVWWIECATRFDDLNWLHGLIRKIGMETEEW